MERVFIGIGSNQGDSVKICLRAVDVLRRHPQIQALKVSSFYRTKPVGFAEQEWFVNGVVECETSMTPEGLLSLLQMIENDFARVRQVKWGPRTLDLDILFFGDHTISLPFLQIPHPRLHERLFVLVPLAEIAPHWEHPTLKATSHKLLMHMSKQPHDQEVHRLELEAS